MFYAVFVIIIFINIMIIIIIKICKELSWFFLSLPTKPYFRVTLSPHKPYFTVTPSKEVCKGMRLLLFGGEKNKPFLKKKAAFFFKFSICFSWRIYIFFSLHLPFSLPLPLLI